MADQISREEFIARFKAEPRLRDVYMLWGDNEVELYGKYRYLGCIHYHVFADYAWGGHFDYTVKSYHALIDHIVANILKVDVPYVENRYEAAYKKYFPNLATERPWSAMQSAISSASPDLLLSGDQYRQELRGVVHLEKMATERKLQLALGDSPLPIPIRQAIIEG